MSKALLLTYFSEIFFLSAERNSKLLLVIPDTYLRVFSISVANTVYLFLTGCKNLSFTIPNSNERLTKKKIFMSLYDYTFKIIVVYGENNNTMAVKNVTIIIYYSVQNPCSSCCKTFNQRTS